MVLGVALVFIVKPVRIAIGPGIGIPSSRHTKDTFLGLYYEDFCAGGTVELFLFGHRKYGLMGLLQGSDVVFLGMGMAKFTLIIFISAIMGVKINTRTGDIKCHFMMELHCRSFDFTNIHFLRNFSKRNSLRRQKSRHAA